MVVSSGGVFYHNQLLAVSDWLLAHAKAGAHFADFPLK